MPKLFCSPHQAAKKGVVLEWAAVATSTASLCEDLGGADLNEGRLASAGHDGERDQNSKLGPG